MSYLGYKDRELDKSIIDWSGITKNISDGLMKTKNDREDQRFEIEKLQNEELDKINNYEQGDSLAQNTFIMKQAQSTRNLLIERHKLMKNGLVSVDDTKLFKQNVSNTWKQISESSKNFNANYKRLADSPGKMNEAKAALMEKQAQLDNKQIYYSDRGEGFYVDVDKSTGKINMDTAVPVKAINNIANQTSVVVDVDTETSKIASRAPEFVIAKSGTTSIDSALQNKEFGKYIDNVVASKLSDDGRMVSVGLDFLNMEYSVDGKPGSTTITYNKIKGFNSDGTVNSEDVTQVVGEIEVDPRTGQPKLTTEQRKIITAAYKNAVVGKIKRKEAKQYVAPVRKTGGEKADENSVGLIDKFVLNGDFSALKSALTGKGFTGIKKPDANGVIRMTDSKGNDQMVSTENMNSGEVGREIAGFLGIAGVYNRKGRAKGSPLNSGILDVANVGSYTSYTSASGVNKSALEKALNPTENKDFAGDITFTPASDKKILDGVHAEVQNLGLDTQKFTVDKGVIYYNEFPNSGVFESEEIGTVGKDSNTNIINKLEALQQQNNNKSGGVPLPKSK